MTLLIFAAAAPAYSQGGDLPAASPRNFNQELQFDHLTVEDGLSSQQVLTILQDSHGFMWFGTFNGLNRYDGHTFTVFRADPDDPHSISSNIIRTIHEDQQGILWIATSIGGLNRFHPVTQTFSYYLNNPDDPHSLAGNNIYTMFEDSKGYLWLGTTSHGLDRFDPATQQFTRYRYDPEDPAPKQAR
jgi:ligand-binding sensor domain-containing protein